MQNSLNCFKGGYFPGKQSPLTLLDLVKSIAELIVFLHWTRAALSLSKVFVCQMQEGRRGWEETDMILQQESHALSRENKFL